VHCVQAFLAVHSVYSVGVKSSRSVEYSHRRGLAAFGGFLVFGACMAALAGGTLTWPNTPFDRIWGLNPRAYSALLPLGRTAGIPLLLLGAILALAAAGWFLRRLWAWRLAALLVATQVLGGVGNLFFARVLEGLTGALIGGALLCYLLRARVRSAFG